MSKKQEEKLTKEQRIKKHERSHKKEHNQEKGYSLQPKHKPNKKQHVNILEAYEKYGEAYEDKFED